MTAFLFIPSGPDTIGRDRVDFGNIAGLFNVCDEPSAGSRMDAPGRLLRAAAFAAIVVALLGDTLLVPRPTILGGSFATPSAHTRITG